MCPYHDQYIEELEQRYYFDDDRIVFADGTAYSLAEAVLLAQDRGLTVEDIQTIHLVKKRFKAQLTGATIGGDEYDISAVDPARDEVPFTVEPRHCLGSTDTGTLQRAPTDETDPLAEMEAEFMKDLPELK